MVIRNQHALLLRAAQLSKKVIKVILMPQNVTDINLSTTISSEITKHRTSATTVFMKVSSVYKTENLSRFFGAKGK